MLLLRARLLACQPAGQPECDLQAVHLKPLTSDRIEDHQARQPGANAPHLLAHNMHQKPSKRHVATSL